MSYRTAFAFLFVGLIGGFVFGFLGGELGSSANPGPRGEQGPTGPQGPAGEQGPAGPSGPAGTTVGVGGYHSECYQLGRDTLGQERTYYYPCSFVPQAPGNQ